MSLKNFIISLLQPKPEISELRYQIWRDGANICPKTLRIYNSIKIIEKLGENLATLKEITGQDVIEITGENTNLQSAPYTHHSFILSENGIITHTNHNNIDIENL